MKIYKSRAVQGTFILMVAGLLTRLIGFYYRIFLSSRIGAEGMGLYQMTFPIYGLCMSLAVSGIQIAISRFVSKTSITSTKSQLHSNYDYTKKTDCSSAPLSALMAGSIVAVSLSVFSALLLIAFGDIVAVYYLHEPRCSMLLRAMAISLPIGTIHCCVNGYFLGKRNAIVPGISQLTEQLSRVVSVYIIFDIFVGDHSNQLPISTLSLIAIAGHILGEIFSMIVSIVAVVMEHGHSSFRESRAMIRPVVTMAYPLTMTRVVLSILHSLEASAIPYFLQVYGLSPSQALSIYGVLTAMAMPFIMFPTTFSNAVCQMLLPTISSAQAAGNKERIHHITMKALTISVSVGLFCTCFFILTGDYLGITFFNNKTAGTFITILAWLCPLMFASTIMGSILNGLGYTKITFYHNLASSVILLAFIIFAIPKFGIIGFLWGLVASELLCAVLHTWRVLME